MKDIVEWRAVPRMSASAGHAFWTGEDVSVCGGVRREEATEERKAGAYPSCQRCKLTLVPPDGTA